KEARCSAISAECTTLHQCGRLARGQEGHALSRQDHVRDRLAQLYAVRRLLRGGHAQSAGRDAEGCEKIFLDRRLGVSALRRRRSKEATGGRRRQAMLRLASAEEGPGLRVFDLHSVSDRCDLSPAIAPHRWGTRV